MSNFESVRKRLLYNKARELSAYDIAAATPPLTKYYSRLKTRPIENIPYCLSLPTLYYTLIAPTASILYQFNFTVGQAFYITSIDHKFAGGKLAIKWRGEGGVTRYFLETDELNGIPVNKYTNQRIPSDCCIEFWQTPMVGAFTYGTLAMYIETSLFTAPSDGDTTFITISPVTVLDFIAGPTNILPMSLPFDNSAMAWLAD